MSGNLASGRAVRGGGGRLWELIVKFPDNQADPLNQFMIVGVKRREESRHYGAWTKATQQLLYSAKDERLNWPIINKIGQRLTEKAEEVSEGAAHAEVVIELNSNDIIGEHPGNSWTYTDDTTGTWLDWFQWQPSWPQPPKLEEEIEMATSEGQGRRFQDMVLFEMLAVNIVDYKVLGHEWVFATSKDSANIKLAQKFDIDPDEIGETVDFFIMSQTQLREPLSSKDVQKVQQVE